MVPQGYKKYIITLCFYSILFIDFLFFKNVEYIPTYILQHISISCQARAKTGQRTKSRKPQTEGGGSGKQRTAESATGFTGADPAPDIMTAQKEK